MLFLCLLVFGLLKKQSKLSVLSTDEYKIKLPNKAPKAK